MRRWGFWGLGPLLLNCSLLYEPPRARQCTNDADCEDRVQLRKLTCDVSYGVCVSKPNALVPGCASTEACTEQNEGRAALCRYPGSPCVKLATPDCPRVSGDWQAGDALILGSIGPHTYGQADHSAPQLDYVQRLVRAIDLGVEEWQRQVPEGLFFSQRPLAIVHCNSNADGAVAQRAMQHLLRDVQVPLVLALTDVEQAAVVSQALDSDVALVCVECYEHARLPPQFEGGLVWRMLPPFEEQAEPLAWRVKDLEQRIRAERGLADTVPLRVAAWSDSGEAFDAFLAKLREVLRFNGEQDVEQNRSNYLEIHNVDPRYYNQDYLAVAGSVVDFAPDIVVVAMNEDFATYYLRIVEAQWPSSIRRPQYVTTFLSQELNQLEPIVADNEDLRRRLSGTALLMDDKVRRNLNGFRTRYRDRFGWEPGRTQAGYAAWYAAALAVYSADAEGRLDGASIATHFTRLTGGALTDVGPFALASARAYLSAQQSVDLVGASSHLDWDPITQRVRAGVDLWCLKREDNGELQLEDNAGPRWNGAEMTGAYDCP